MEIETIEDVGTAVQEACPICGANDFYQEGGFYYCTLCNTQSQVARLYVDENFRQEYQQGRTHVAVLRGEKRKKETIKERQQYLSTWEVWNVVLKAMADRLIEIGFPETIKAKIFDMYVSYLIKREVIFVSNANKKSRITIGEPKTNYYAFYDAIKKKPPRKKRAIRSKKIIQKKDRVKKESLESSLQTDHHEAISLSQKKKRETWNKRKAIEKEYLAKGKDIPDVDEQEFENLIAQEKSGDISQKPIGASSSQRKRIYPVYTKLAQKFLKASLQKSSAKFRALKKGRFAMFVALRELGFPVVMSDILRLYILGILQIDNIKQLINEIEEYQNKSVVYINVVLPTNRLTCTENLSEDIESFLEYMKIKEFQCPKIKDTIPKYIDEFVLPLEFECLLNLINSLFTFDNFAGDLSGKVDLYRYRMLPEVIVLSQFIVIMKLLFGLDDKTEKFQSEFAKLVNKVVKKEVASRQWEMEEWTELFVIEEWFGYLQRRRAVVTRELCCPLMYTPNNPPSIIKLQDMMKNCLLNDDESENDAGKKTAQSDAANYCKGLFHTITKERVSTETGQDIPKLKQYVPLPLPTESIVRQYVERYPMVADSSVKPDLLIANFIKKRIDFIWNPKKYKTLLRLHKYKVKVIKGDAVNNFPTELSDQIAESKVILLFQPYKSFDEFVGSCREECSYSTKLLLGLCEDIIPGLKTDALMQPFLQKLVNSIGDMFIKRILAELLPIFTKWAEPDSDSDSE